VRFAWSRGRAFGIGYLATNREATKLDGIWWHEQVPDRFHVGEAWYGDRVGNADAVQLPVQQVAQAHIQKVGRFPLYTLIYSPNGEVDRAASRSAFDFIRLALNEFPQFRVRLVVTEFDDRDPDKNLLASRERAKALAAALAAEGIPANRVVIDPIGSPMQLADRGTPMHRAMYTRVDFALTGK
jgi:hypothetical protein